MALTRTSKFGYPPNTPPPSSQTVRLVPLTQGMKADTAWPLLPPGSSVSMTNFLPLDGKLLPRSRLSSLNTISAGFAYNLYPTLAELNFSTPGATPAVWMSQGSQHATIDSNGSISMASFVSAGGLGGTPNTDATTNWSHCQAFGSALNENILVAAKGMTSADTLQVLYHSTGYPPSAPYWSYLTSAPKGATAGVFDSYVVVLGVTISAGVGYANRVQWCVRGNLSNWTSEGSGYEDLVEMLGQPGRVVGGPDGRVYLLTTLQIWYGVSAAYPAQFLFLPLDKSAGIVAPKTLAVTSEGLVFLSSDMNLSLLPWGSVARRVLSPGLGAALRGTKQTQAASSWGVFDRFTNLYHLCVNLETGSTAFFVVNVITGEFARTASDVLFASTGAGLAVGAVTSTNEGLLFFESSGRTLFSTNSLKAIDSGSAAAVTSTWQSAVIAADLPGTYKQLQNVNIDYRATSRSTVTLKISQDGGNNYESTGKSVSLTSAPYAGRASVDVYSGGAFPTIELTSTSTGFELHRVDATFQIGGQR